MSNDNAPALALQFRYKNHNAKVGDRCATPIGWRYGVSVYHPVPTWLMVAFDHDCNAIREFDMTKADFYSLKLKGKKG